MLRGGPDSPQVLSRLQALFGPNSPSRSVEAVSPGQLGGAGVDVPAAPVAERLPFDPSTGHYLGADMTRPRSEPPFGRSRYAGASSSTLEVKDRKALLVKVVTWNMGDALPKGDLSVLLGSVPDYSPLPTENGFPVVPIEDAHPYHIVVVAGQECPTESGVPRGLAGGVLRGMKLGNHLRKEKKDKEKEKEKENDKEGKELEKEAAEHLEEAIQIEAKGERVKEGDGKEGLGVPKDSREQGAADKSTSLLAPGQTDEADSSESIEMSRSGSPAPASQTGSSAALGHTPSLHRHQHHQGSKGWSTMLDDWLCGPVRPVPSKEGSKDDKPVPAPGHSPFIDINVSREPDSLSMPTTPILSPHSPSTVVGTPFLRAEAPGMTRSSSSTLNVPGWTANPSLLGVSQQAHHPLGHSPLARSPASFSSLASASDSSDSEIDSGMSHLPAGTSPAPMSAGPTSITASPRKIKPERPTLMIPTDGDRPEGSKCYLHLVKERLMGMYLSVYVHRDCRDLIGGLDKDFVTTGLAGGRLGNKGGIGISLKLADHRLLFVNSHLAAHTARNSARMANIAKIKSELQLDCFLPKDDPRMECGDIADRFDTVFWCGDLNFRLDMSRLHAEWLVEQKKYDEALTWDQLKIAMKDPDTSPFPGFEEGLINFPPTFKYDVWKSARATNREIRRSLRRRGSVKDSGPPDLSKTVGSTLGHVPESGAEDMDDDDLVTAGRMSEDDQPRRSMESSRSSRSVSRGTEAGDDGSDDLDDLQGRGNAAKLNGLANSHRPLDVKIKEKTKKMFGLVKLKTALTPSPGRKAFGKDGKDRRDRVTESPKPSLDGRGLPPPPQLHSFTVIRKSTAASGETDFDAQSRRTSLSSLASMREAQPPTAAVVDFQGNPAGSPRVSNLGDMPLNVRPSDTAMPIPSTPTYQTVPDPMLSMSPSEAAAGGGRVRRPTIGSQAQASPPRAGRSFSLKRTMSGRSAKLGTSLGSSAVIDEAEDNREGVYDSSKKQRVPSWCDRVLWKAHPEPDPEPEPEATPPEEIDISPLADHPEKPKPLVRLAAALHTLGGHLRPQPSRTFSVPPENTGISRIGSANQLDRVKTAQPATTFERDGGGSLTPTLVDSPISSPALTPKVTGLVPLPLSRRGSRSPGPRRISVASSAGGSVSTNSSPEKLGANKKAQQARSRAQTYDSRPSKPPRDTHQHQHHRHPLLRLDTSASTHAGAGTAISSINASQVDGHIVNATPSKPRITFEPASSPSADRSAASAALGTGPSEAKSFRARANSDCHDASARSRLASSIGLGPVVGSRKDPAGPTTTPGSGKGISPSPSFPPARRATDELLSTQNRHSAHAASGFTASAPASHHIKPVPLYGETTTNTHLGTSNGYPMRRSSTHATPSGHTGHAAEASIEEKGAFARFFRDIPNWLHRHTTHVADEPALLSDNQQADDLQEVRVRRHMKGEVVCLGYGTIDDAGMRALEGRSDHRPAIFSAAIYIDK